MPEPHNAFNTGQVKLRKGSTRLWAKEENRVAQDNVIDTPHVQEMNLAKSDYEFQMLHGVRTKLRDQIVNHGHRLRVYVPFGQYWYAYSIRRFKKNPQIVWYVFQAIFSGS